MLAGDQRAASLAAAWREVAVGGNGGQTLIHSDGGWSVPEVVNGGGLDFGGMWRWWLDFGSLLWRSECSIGSWG